MTRAEQLVELKARFSRVVSKRGSMLLSLCGEAGVGKTWLAEHLLCELPCRYVSLPATTRSTELVQKLPHSERLPQWAEHLLESLAKGKPADTAAIANAVTTLLMALAPFVLHIEDWHEVSPEQRELWLELAVMLRCGHGVGLLIAGRTAAPAPFEAVQLEHLSREEAVQLLEIETQTPLPAEAHSWIFERAEGNPLFTLEYFRFLSKQGILWSDGRRWHWRTPQEDVMPTSIEALIAQLLQTATPSAETQAVTGAKALLPTGTSDELWEAVAGTEPGVLDNVKLQLAQQGLLVGSAFTHRLIHEVARRELTQERRCELARRAVELLEHEHPEAAAALVEEAELAREDTRRILKRAAEGAFAASNRHQAAIFLARVTNYTSGEEQASLALEAARLLHNIDVPEALRLAGLSLTADPHNVEAAFLRVQLLASLGLREEAEQLLSSFPKKWHKDARWLHTFIEVRVNVYDYAGALKLWHEHPKIQAVANPPTRAHVARALVQLGKFAEAGTFLENAMNVCGLAPVDHAWLQNTYALIPLIEGDFKTAVDRYDGALEILSNVVEGAQERYLVLTRQSETLWMRSLALYRWGRYHEAIANLESYLHVVAEQGNGRRYAEGQVNLGAYLTEVGEFERAEEMLLESRSVLERGDNIRWLAVVEQQLVHLYLDWSPPHGGALALKHAKAADFYARQAQSPPHLAETLCFVSRAEAMHGQPHRALELVDELQSLAANLGEERIEAFGDWVRGLALEKLGQRERALQSLETGVDRMARLGHLPFAHRLALEIDRIQGNVRATAARIQHFERIGDHNWLNIAYRYFPQLTSSATPQEAPLTLQLQVLGPLLLVQDGVPITYTARQGKILLILLLEARLVGRSGINQLDLLDTLYPDIDEHQAVAALKQLVYRLRSKLGSGVITRTSDGYALGNVSSDAEAFLQVNDTTLWRGPYLQDLDGGWSSSARTSLYYALRLQAALRLQSDPEEAVRIGRLLLEADSYDLEALSLCLSALSAIGNTLELVRLYGQSREEFSEIGERLPESWQTFLQGYTNQRAMA